MINLWDWIETQINEAETEHVPVTRSSGLKDYQLAYLQILRAKVILGKEGVLLTEPKQFLLDELKQYKMPVLGNTAPDIAPRHESDHIVDFLELLLENLQYLEARYEH